MEALQKQVLSDHMLKDRQLEVLIALGNSTKLMTDNKVREQSGSVLISKTSNLVDVLINESA